MPRSNWRGHISFGLVSIPIDLYTTENKSADISFHQIDDRDNARIKYQRVNAETGKLVPWEHIARGYAYDKETTIPVPDTVLEKVAGENSHNIDIQSFIDAPQLDVLFIDRKYYLVPNEKGKGSKGYVILRETLKEMKKVAIAKVIISTKEYYAAVSPYEDALIMSLLKYDKEVRKPSEVALPKEDLKYYKITKKEMEMAKQLIKSMSAKWQPEKYVDEYQFAIHQWIDETIHDLPHHKKEKKKAPPSNVIDFAELLKKSLKDQVKPKKTKLSRKHK